MSATNPTPDAPTAARPNWLDWLSPDRFAAGELLAVTIQARVPRPSAGYPPTDAERARTRPTVRAVRELFAGHRWPAPLEVDIGDGYALVYRLAEPLSAGAAARLTAALARQWSGTKDAVVCGQVRPLPAVGSKVKSAGASTSRPVRECRVSDAPDDWRPGLLGGTGGPGGPAPVAALLAELPTTDPWPDGVAADDPTELARWTVAAVFTDPDGRRTLQHWHDEFYHHVVSAYRKLTPGIVRNIVTRALTRRAAQAHAEGEAERMKVLPTLVTAVTACLAAECQLDLPDGVEPPCWLPGADGPDAQELFAVANGLVDVRSRKLLPADPRYFGFSAAPYAFNAEAPEPAVWLDFLARTYPGDPNTIRMIRQFFGLCLTSYTHYQKMLLMVGKTRSGKGTVLDALAKVVGETNYCPITLVGLAGDHGLSQMPGGLVAAVEDAEDDPNIIQKALPVLKGLSGSKTGRAVINPKGRDFYQARLTRRIAVASNVMLVTDDGGGALASRWLVAVHNVSFLGKEDLTLGDRIAAEIASILNWALAGYADLVACGRFVVPEGSAAAVSIMREESDPVTQFVFAECVVGPGLWAAKADVRKHLEAWCRRHDVSCPNARKFKAKLGLVVPGLKPDFQPRDPATGKQVEAWGGFSLRSDGHDDPAEADRLPSEPPAPPTDFSRIDNLFH